ncbi:MAG: DNA polymerase IV, partial [Solobacterium sp.]|nr:DNA polymerase IV [Solobacterium sp.]
SKRMREEKKAGYTVSLRIRYYDFQNADRSKKLSEPIWQSDDIFVQALSLFDEHWEDEPVRLLGISLSDFASSGQLVSQIGLFDPAEAEKKETESVLKDLNEQLGRTGFRRASDLLGEKK